MFLQCVSFLSFHLFLINIANASLLIHLVNRFKKILSRVLFFYHSKWWISEGIYLHKKSSMKRRKICIWTKDNTINISLPLMYFWGYFQQKYNQSTLSFSIMISFPIYLSKFWGHLFFPMNIFILSCNSRCLVRPSPLKGDCFCW